MIVIYNSLATSGILATKIAPFDVAAYHEIMAQHGMGLTACLWIVPGTLNAPKDETAAQ